MTRGIVTIVGFCALFFPSVGCSSTVLFTTWTTTGLEVSGAGTNQAATLGYERFEGVVMPDRIPHVEKNSPEDKEIEAYPVASRYRLQTGNISIASLGSVRIVHVFASGRAAIQEKAGESINADFEYLVGLGKPETVDHAQEIRRLLESAGEDEKKELLAAISDALGDGGTISVGRAKILIGEAVDAKRSKDLEELHARIKKIAEGG